VALALPASALPYPFTFTVTFAACTLRTFAKLALFYLLSSLPPSSFFLVTDFFAPSVAVGGCRLRPTWKTRMGHHIAFWF